MGFGPELHSSSASVSCVYLTMHTCWRMRGRRHGVEGSNHYHFDTYPLVGIVDSNYFGSGYASLHHLTFYVSICTHEARSFQTSYPQRKPTAPGQTADAWSFLLLQTDTMGLESLPSPPVRIEIRQRRRWQSVSEMWAYKPQSVDPIFPRVEACKPSLSSPRLHSSWRW